MPALTGPVFEPFSGTKPDNAIILLHGVGADGENLIGLADFMLKDFPDTVFIAPNGPFGYDMAPPGYGYQWFSLADRRPEVLLAGLQTVAPIVDKFIDEVMEEYNLPANKIALIGFSQGTMTSLYVAPRRAEKLAAVVGYSGALLAPERLKTEVKTHPDICLIHGEIDDVVPAQATLNAQPVLHENGFHAEIHLRPNLPHSIDPEGIAIATKFLKSRL